MAGMNAATMRLLAAKGLSMDDIIEVAESLEKKADPTNAERQARYRAKRKRNAVTVTGVSPNDIYSNPVSSDEETSAERKSKLEKPDDVTTQTWTDFTALRTRQKAPASATAIAGIRREADKAGWTLEAALGEAVARGWRGFKADWVQAQKTGPPNTDPMIASILSRHQQTEPAQ